MWRFHKALWDLSGGRLGASIGRMKVLELTTTGHRSGSPRSVLLYYLESPRGPLLAGSNLGSDSDPAWIKNLRAVPEATIRRGSDIEQVRAIFLAGKERDIAYERFADVYTDYQDYEAATQRQIPVVALEPRSVPG